MDKRKILIVAASLRIGGAEKVARDIALHDSHQEFEYHYIVFGDQVGEYESELQAHGCRIFHLPPPSRSYRVFWRELRQLMKEHRYHAVHAHNMFNCGLSMAAARCTGVPVRISHAHSALDYERSWVKRLYEGFMRMLILSCSTDLVACGVKAGIRLFGQRAYERRGKLILNGINVEACRFDPQRRNALRRELGFENDFLIGHTGHLMDVKNQQHLIRLMPKILAQKPNARLILLGEGPDRQMLEELVRSLDLEDRVLMPGNVRNIPDWLSAMDVFAFPSLYEGTPLSVIEAQANGLPCILSTGVPADVHLTDLVQTLALSDREASWTDAICSARRGQPEQYARLLLDSDFHTARAMEQLFQIYRKGISL